MRAHQRTRAVRLVHATEEEVAEWDGFRIGEPAERWSADLRPLIDLLPAAAAREIQVPKSFVLAFGGGVLDRLQTTSRESAHVRWRQRIATQLDPEASQSRDWQEEADDTDSAT